ncbi:MAG: sugar transferase [Patescibacteria group bacterium]
MLRRTNFYLAGVAIIVDLVAIFLAMMVSYRLRAEGSELHFWPEPFFRQFVILMLPVWLILLASQGLYNLRSLPRGWSSFSRLLIGLLSGWGVMIIVLYLWRSPAAVAFPRLVIAYGLFLTLLFAVIGRWMVLTLERFLYLSGQMSIRTVIIAKNKKNRFIGALEQSPSPRREITVIGAVMSDRYLEKLTQLHQEKLIEEVVIADPDLDEKTQLEILSWAEDRGVSFILVPSILAVRATNVEVGSLASEPVMYFLRTPLEGWRRVEKRLFDLVLVILAIIILSPLALLVAVLVKISSPGPLIFRQVRVGQDGRQFYIHKFRSMYLDNNQRYPRFGGWSASEANDPRVTPLGRLLRRSNLDEIPQLFDILVGTMSVVGPRPEQPNFVRKFSDDILDYPRRHHVKSGLTGWAQVNGLRGDTSISERVKYDLYYIEHWTIWFDLRIIGSTFIIFGRGVFGNKK